MNKEDNIETVLNSPDKGVSQTSGYGGILSRLWRQMLLDLNVGLPQFGHLLQSYVTDPRNGVANNRKDQISTRGNLAKEFARKQMTWKIFIKALRFINIAKVEFIIQAHHHNGKITVHNTLINFGTNTTLNELDDSSDNSDDE